MNKVYVVIEYVCHAGQRLVGINSSVEKAEDMYKKHLEENEHLFILAIEAWEMNGERLETIKQYDSCGECRSCF